MLYAADGERKAATAVSEGYTKVGEAAEDTTEDHGTDSPCSFSRHAYQPGEPVLLHISLTHHLPWMDEEGAAELLGGLPERIEVGVAEVFTVDVGAYFKAGHMELTDAALHFFYRQIDILQGNCADADEAIGVLLYTLSYMIVEEAGGFEAVVGLSPVVEQYGDGG